MGFFSRRSQPPTRGQNLAPVAAQTVVEPISVNDLLFIDPAEQLPIVLARIKILIVKLVVWLNDVAPWIIRRVERIAADNI